MELLDGKLGQARLRQRDFDVSFWRVAATPRVDLVGQPAAASLSRAAPKRQKRHA